MSYDDDQTQYIPISRVAIETLYAELSSFYQERAYEFLERCLIVQKNQLSPIIEEDEPTLIVRRTLYK